MFIEFLKTPIGMLGIHAEDDVITALQLVGEIAPKENRNRITKECKRQLEEYFGGIRTRFELPLKIEGTEFQKAVWRELLQIGYGATRSYGDIAINIGRPNAQRAVGAANRLNCLPIIIPCHRVIGRDGKLVGYGLGMDNKRWLLQHESAGRDL